MREPQRQQVRVRRTPRVGVFLAIGAIAGAVVAVVAVGVSPSDPRVTAPQALGYLALVLAPLGALITGGIAVLIDAVGERRARIVQAERTAAGEDGQPPA